MAKNELGEWDWWVTDSGTVLHAAEVDVGNSEVYGPGTTMCGRQCSFLAIPGMFSRMGARRCTRCCQKMGYPLGFGSPKNDPACRPFVERRLKPAPVLETTDAPAYQTTAIIPKKTHPAPSS